MAKEIKDIPTTTQLLKDIQAQNDDVLAMDAYQGDRVRGFIHALMTANRYAHVLAKNPMANWQYGSKDHLGNISPVGRVDITPNMVWQINRLAFHFYVSEEVQADPVLKLAVEDGLSYVRAEEEKGLISREGFERLWNARSGK